MVRVRSKRAINVQFATGSSASRRRRVARSASTSRRGRVRTAVTRLTICGTGPHRTQGTEAHVRDLFPDGYAGVDYSAERFGPLMMLRGYLEQRREWAALRERMAQILDSGAPNE